MRVGANQYARAVGRKNVAVERLHLLPLRVVHVEQNVYLFAGLKRIAYDALPVVAYLRIEVGARNGFDTADVLWRERTIGNLFQVERASRRNAGQRQEEGHARYDYFFHD